MSQSRYTVLVEVVTTYRESGDPQTRASLAESLDVPEEALSTPLDRLTEFDLVEATEEGYRPTVTGRELLELDADPDDLFVLDVVDEEE